MPALTKTSTGDDVVAAFPGAIAGKTVFITGANSGLGYETARVLAAAGADVIAACRSQTVADETAGKLRAAVGAAAKVTPWVVDLGDLTQVAASAAAYVASGRPLHVLINNAGIMATPLARTKQGFESQFGSLSEKCWCKPLRVWCIGVCGNTVTSLRAPYLTGVNHLGTFVLTSGLMPALLRSTPARVVNLSSTGHAFLAPAIGIDFADLAATKSYSPTARYGQVSVGVGVCVCARAKYPPEYRYTTPRPQSVRDEWNPRRRY